MVLLVEFVKDAVPTLFQLVQFYLQQRCLCSEAQWYATTKPHGSPTTSRKWLYVLHLVTVFFSLYYRCSA